MTSLTLPLTQLIHERLAVILNYAFSRRSLEKLFSERFRGEWKYLSKTMFGISSSKAAQACLEFATLMRVLDDREGLSDYLRETRSPSFGVVFKNDDLTEELHLRDVTNKLLHTKEITFSFGNPDDPVIVCTSADDKRRKRAKIRIVLLAAFCGQLMHWIEA